LAFLFWAVRKQLDVLVLVDFDERDPDRSVVALQIVRLCVSKEVLIKLARLLQVAQEQSHVRNAENPRALYFFPGLPRRSHARQK